jgi:DNA-directed RNA polymerase III subunit RPC11
MAPVVCPEPACDPSCLYRPAVPPLPRAHTPPRHARIPAVTCPSCQADQAYFVEVQTRSADEPATLFYKCVDCGHRWKEG